jgi:hypothetical protein
MNLPVISKYKEEFNAGKLNRRLLALYSLLAAAAIFFSGYIVRFLENIAAPCPVYTRLGLYCPACGNTRSLEALLRGDLPLSMRHNPAILFLTLLAAAFYTETAFRAFGKQIKLIPRGRGFVVSVIMIFAVYYILRNTSLF